MEGLQAEFLNNHSGHESVNIQIGQPEPDRLKQSVLNDKTVAIGFCGTDREFDCTVTAISAANYIAASGYKAALVEPDFSKGTVLHKLLPGLSENGVISMGNVDYYAGWNLADDIYSADVVVFDFISMNYEEAVYLGKMKKIFICSDTEIMDKPQSGKLENNSSFRYSILFSDVVRNPEAASENETMVVFKECSLELKRLLKITLQSFGIDITKISDSNTRDRIDQLNMLRQSEISKGNGLKTKPERQAKYEEPAPSKPDPVPKSSNIKREENIKTPQPMQRLQQYNKEPEPERPKESAPKVIKPKAIVPSNTYREDNLRNVNIDTAKNDNQIRNQTKVQDDDYYNYIGIDSKKDTNSANTSFKEASSPPRTVSSPSQQQKKENRSSLLTGRLSPGKDNESEEVLIFHSNTAKNEADEDYEEDYEAEELNDGDYKYDYHDHKSNNKNNYQEDYGQNNVLDYAEEIKFRFKKKQSTNQVLCGKETIFVTGLKHGCGCSHTGISFAKYILNAYSENICICHKKGAYDLEEDDITEYTKETDYDNIFSTNRFIIYDCGILGELNQEQLIELKRCNIKIMVCTGDEKYLGNLAKFIRQLGKSSEEWIFAFNLVTSREKETMIRKIMEGYKICFIPLHESENPPRKVGKLWDSVLKRNLL